MNELAQAQAFYSSLTDEQKKELQEAIAEHIYFLDEQLQKEIIILLECVSSGLGKEVSIRNNFTM